MTKTAATKFQVRWRKSDEPDTLWSSPVDVGKDGNVKVPGLERVTDYVFQARAGSDCGAWSDWVVQTFNMPDATLPSAVTSLTAQSVADGVHLAWASVIADGGTIFSVERSSSATSGFTERAQTRATAYTDPETSGTVYYYRVRALNFRGGTGPYSNVVSSQGVAVDQLGDDVQAAQTAADDAQHAADAANTQLAAIASDSILSPAEKPAVIRDYDVITTEQAGIDGQATAYSITTEKTAYDNAVSALTAYLATLTTDTAWNDKSGNTTIVAATFKQKFTDVYSARQVLLNAIYAAAKLLADTAQKGVNANAPLVNNPYFSTGDLSGWTSDHGTVAFQSGTNGPAAGSSAYAIRTGSSGTPAEAFRNTAKIPVYLGAQIKAQCAIRGIGTPNGAAGVRISWRNSSDTEISTTQGTTTTGNATNGTYVTGTAPSGAMFAHVECSFSSHTVGQYTVDNFWAAALPDTMDQVPDGTNRFGAIEAGADKTSGKPLSSLSGRTMDYIGDSATRFAAAEAGADKTAGKPLDVLVDGVYARPKATALQNGIPLQASTGRNLVVNGSFEANASGAQFGDGWIPNGVAILGRNTAVSGGPSPVALQYNQSPGTVIPTGYAYYVVDSAVNLTGLRIGDTVYISAQFNNAGGSLPAGITGTVQVELDFLNSGGTTISSVVATSPQTAGWPTATGNGVVPTGTVATRARVLIYTNNTTGSAYTVPAGQYPFFGYVDNITAYAVANADTDVMDGTTNGRIAMADVYGVGGANRVGLRVAGSGHTLGDQRNLLLQTWGGMRSVLSNSPISFSISGTTVNFSVAAVTLQGAGSNLPYAASSGSVTQAAGTTTTYFLYYIDNAQAGGSLPLNITTNPGGPASWPNGVLLGTAVVTVASGGGGSSGTGGGGGGYCVADDMYIGEGRLAGNAEIGDPFDCIDLPTSAGKHVRAMQGVSRGVEECVRMITSDGCALVCSVSTPFDLPDGRSTTAPRMLGEQVITDLGTAAVISLALVGPRPVTRAHLGGVSYAAGADPNRRIYSHNIGGTSKP